jgi:hypothetical protein
MQRGSDLPAQHWFANRRAWASLIIPLSLLFFLLLAAADIRVSGQENPADLGDAPDSEFNHHGITNTAYFLGAPILGRFPTVWEGGATNPPSGPRHGDARVVFLGNRVTLEDEADIGPDADGFNNILSDAAGAVVDIADQDGADDGWLNPAVPMLDCRPTTLRVRVSRGQLAQYDSRMFLNVWFDGNRDGDWADVKACTDQRPGFEWIVQNFIVDPNTIAPGSFVDILVPTQLVFNEKPILPAWIRFTLSDMPAPTIPGTPLADGRGPLYPAQYELGETEDYFVEGILEGEPGEISIEKSSSDPAVGVGQVFTYSLVVASQPTGSALASTIVTDVLHPAVKLVRGPFVSELSPSVTPLSAYFVNAWGPSGAIGWYGSLTPGAAAQIDYAVKVEECPPTGLIENRAVALQIDGSIVTATQQVVVDCETPPAPEISLRKVIVRPDGTLTDDAPLLPGQATHYQLVLTSTGMLTHAVHISDDLPPGLLAVGASASSGVVNLANAGKTVLWNGLLGPANRPVRISIRAKLVDEVRCGRVLNNQALWFTRFSNGESNVVRSRLVCNDLGDAPDSTNHFATPMAAYSGVTADYPTVFEITTTMRGPLHLRPRPLHLGRLVSFEFEADIGPDVDPTNNILPPRGWADKDKADDGLELDKMNFAHCQFHRFPVWITVDPTVIPALEQNDGLAYLNVWVDGNRNGGWADLHQCNDEAAPEHIVIDHPVNVAALGPGLHRITVPRR